ncbi:MAG TPA: urate hydroxylase PuuD [Xanthobacteraceae bacterium]|nr:urate hydroxylase PuuD [Xanthobacteraceae bacterium]
MTSILQSLGRTISAGVVLLIVIVAVAGALSGQMVRLGDHAYWQFFMRWLHILSGVMWVGLLYYLNFVQIPTVPKIEPAEHRAAISKFIMPNVLFWFRYGAVATVATGLLLAWMNGYIVQALLLQNGAYPIGIGMWIALIMAYNVWFIIWPNQKKVLGLVQASAEDKQKAARVALLTSRVNTLLSIPMLYMMAAQSHGGL